MSPRVGVVFDHLACFVPWKPSLVPGPLHDERYVNRLTRQANLTSRRSAVTSRLIPWLLERCASHFPLRTSYYS
jgi:hypothetical protein